MTYSLPSKSRLRAPVAIAAVVATVCALFAPVLRAGSEGGAEKVTEQSSAKQKLTGQDLYAINCSRCHSERYPTEWTSAHWKTLLTHMRVRANLPAAQAREILKYLQDESGSN